jgi:hypothetical protein
LERVLNVIIVWDFIYIMIMIGKTFFSRKMIGKT